ncbi:uncharacterized protein LOC126839548 [Adelges cooleyi]|uniref:uncharacterized protein LOC126839548 n=1 Tax=Adelges cooleyi TaxID=133065 RepID=UPI00217FE739|nr:uncharacterized protein LOC126839548 [Adelges cooleyi]
MYFKKIITLTIVSLFVLIAITAVNGRPSGTGGSGSYNCKGVAVNDNVRFFGLEDRDAEERKRISAAIKNSEGQSFDGLVSKVWSTPKGSNSGAKSKEERISEAFGVDTVDKDDRARIMKAVSTAVTDGYSYINQHEKTYGKPKGANPVLIFGNAAI